jgi:hypothetical protein
MKIDGFCGMFYCALRSETIASSGGMAREWESMWKKTLVSYSMYYAGVGT